MPLSGLQILLVSSVPLRLPFFFFLLFDYSGFCFSDLSSCHSCAREVQTTSVGPQEETGLWPETRRELISRRQPSWLSHASFCKRYMSLTRYLLSSPLSALPLSPLSSVSPLFPLSHLFFRHPAHVIAVSPFVRGGPAHGHHLMSPLWHSRFGFFPLLSLPLPLPFLFLSSSLPLFLSSSLLFPSQY